MTRRLRAGGPASPLRAPCQAEPPWRQAICVQQGITLLGVPAAAGRCHGGELFGAGLALVKLLASSPPTSFHLCAPGSARRRERCCRLRPGLGHTGFYTEKGVIRRWQLAPDPTQKPRGDRAATSPAPGGGRTGYRRSRSRHRRVAPRWAWSSSTTTTARCWRRPRKPSRRRALPPWRDSFRRRRRAGVTASTRQRAQAGRRRPASWSRCRSGRHRRSRIQSSSGANVDRAEGWCRRTAR